MIRQPRKAINILILSKEINDIRLLQRVIEKMEINPILFLEWDPLQASGILRQQNIDILICETTDKEGRYVDFLADRCGRADRPEIIALMTRPEEAVWDKLEELQEIFFLKSPLDDARTEKVLERVIQKVEKKQYTTSLEKSDYYWKIHKHAIQQQYWMRLCTGQVSGETVELIKEAEDCGIEMKLSDTYQIALLSRKLLKGRNTEVEKQTRKSLLNLAEQYFTDQEIDSVILDMQRPLLIMKNMPEDEFLYYSKGLIQRLRREQDFPLCIYYDINIFCENIFSSVVRIMEFEREDYVEASGVYPVIQSGRQKKEEIDLSFQNMEEILRNGHYTQFLQNLRTFFQEKAGRGNLSGSYLRAMRLDLSQMFYCILMEQSIPAHKVMMDQDLKELEKNAHISVDSFMAWAEEMLGRMAVKKETVSMSEAIKKYVRKHCGENMSRKTVAAAFYMNEDYLGRIFKKETGQHLGNYITEEKMKKAQYLLESTKKSIGEIAMELGYENFSHFSKLFKRTIGCTPREYRSTRVIEDGTDTE